MSEHATFTRTVEAELAAGDGRTVEARIAPYGVPARVADPPKFEAYDEMFVPGAFEAQTRAAGRVKIWLNFEHDQGLRGIVGHGLTLDERTDGLYGTFRVHENGDGDKALQLVRDGLLTGLSLEFAALRSRVVAGVVQRIRAHIDKVSLCRFPAYADAQVLAVRTAPPAEVAPAAPADEALVERLAALGVEPLNARAVTRKAWDASPARYTPDEYKRATILDGSLAVLEPNGDLNINALGAASAALAGVGGGHAKITGAQKAAAARKLIRYYRQAGMEPPANLVTMAGR
jgi:Escherichia/Staphylococcus phage prohead protease